MSALPQNIGGAGKALTSGSGSKETTYKSGNCWTLSGQLGLQQPAEMDTLLYNYQRIAVPAMVTDAYATTGNVGAPGQDEIYFGRTPRTQFFFRDAVSHWLPSFEKQKFYNVYIPMTLLSYNFAGSSPTKTDRLNAVFAGNVNRRFGAGGDIEYLISKGNYANQATKNFRFGLNGYYKGDRYEMQAFFSHYNLLLKENGGITDDLYITDPAELQGGVSTIEPTSIPTRLSAAHSRVNGSQFFMNHAFNVGYWREEQVNDTLTRDVYVPVTKFIYSLDYKADSHLFVNTNRQQAEDLWGDVTYLNPDQTYDRTHTWSLENTLGVQMIEGFHPKVKFGLSAFAAYEIQRFRLPADYAKGLYENDDAPGDADAGQPESPLTPLPEGVELTRRHTQQAFRVGAELTKQHGSILTYAAKARLGLAGYALGDLELDGRLRTRIPLFRDTVEVGAELRFHNTEVPWLLQNYVSNHLAWNNSFGKTRTFRAGGEIYIPWTRSRLEAGVENVQNHVYFDAQGLPHQCGASVQVFSARLTQKIKAGIWNWDNTVTYQASSRQDIIPLPTLAVYSNMYLRFLAFRVLDLQIGVDCDYFTRYRGVSYQPATMAFTLSDGPEVGNYPLCNAYVTAKLYKVRFFVLCSHVNQGLGPKNYFSMAHYPINPRRFQFGLSIDFAD